MADCFLDTNVLLYAVSTNPAEADKARIAREMMQTADWAWSAQVAAEFIRASTSPRQPKPLTRAEARRCPTPTMNPLPDDPWLREKFRELRRRDAETARGFVCVLDLRPARRSRESHPTGRFLACAALFALTGFLAGLWVTSRPAHPLHLDAAAVQLTAWKSPTGFLLADNFSPTQPN